MAVSDEIKYTQEHEWVKPTAEGTVRIGITDYAQQQLGDVVFVQLPDVGEQISSGETIGEVESTKSVSDLYAPLTGTVTARNEQLDDEPELINSQPMGGGWMIEMEFSDPDQWAALLDADGYRNAIDQE